MSRINKRKTESEKALPIIPDKRYFSISEASHLCGVKAYVLRYWEQEFNQLKPIKHQRGNRRYYQKQDILLIRQIKTLLYDEGFTIEGARTKLISPPVLESQSIKSEITVKKIIAELETLLQNLRAV